MATINKELFARLWYVSKFGRRDHRDGAIARLHLLREARHLDRRFPSGQPVLPSVETESWTWWHWADEESSHEEQTAPQERLRQGG